jgi:hypothetical protein
MPAIQLSRLRIQAAQLADLISTPEIFVRSLKTILEFYSDRTHRPGQSGDPPPLLPTYNVPPPVLKQILQELGPRLSGDQENGLSLCDLLWVQEQYECRLLAARIFGLLPVKPLEPIQSRLIAWSRESEERVLTTLLSDGLSRWRKEDPLGFLSILEEWLKSPSFHDQILGLEALLPLINDKSFDNLPVLFRLLYPLVRVAPPAIRPNLIPVLESLAKRSPKECAYFLRENMVSLDTAWLTRQILGIFPVEIQKGLRETMKNPKLQI